VPNVQMKRVMFAKLLGEFQDVFAWSYEDIHGFDPGLIHHGIPIQEGIKLVRKKQRPIKPAQKQLFERSWKNY
jgi:hypothetical protein